jgi:hypothetical protein
MQRLILFRKGEKPGKKEERRSDLQGGGGGGRCRLQAHSVSAALVWRTMHGCCVLPLVPPLLLHGAPPRRVRLTSSRLVR